MPPFYREILFFGAGATGGLTIYFAVMTVLEGGPVSWVIGVTICAGLCGASLFEIWQGPRKTLGS
jgi:hypothetical protein